MVLIHVFASLLLSFHPFHVSVMSVHHAADENSLQITLKIFADDLEEALNNKQFRKEGAPFVDVLNPDNPQQLDQQIEQYLRKHIELKVNGKVAKASYLGKEMEDLAMWCYFEVKDVEELNSLSVSNSLLTEIFDDQINIVHANTNGVTKSMKLAGNRLLDSVSF
ncbi:hypothetical protein PZB74_12960 [Porifericola rhodea]|uniref:DUF6702 family protein n=1 Tax=Porifericola rhodea TaxID=930972 RepID=UPI00266671D3|nr:DUF6702 family protein [Porifericola rhodea]WKN29875.1 hypothetical protein PZB74_12960 [Porifericola rhodea]